SIAADAAVPNLDSTPRGGIRGRPQRLDRRLWDARAYQAPTLRRGNAAIAGKNESLGRAANSVGPGQALGSAKPRRLGRSSRYPGGAPAPGQGGSGVHALLGGSAISVP